MRSDEPTQRRRGAMCARRADSAAAQRDVRSVGRTTGGATRCALGGPNYRRRNAVCARRAELPAAQGGDALGELVGGRERGGGAATFAAEFAVDDAVRFAGAVVMHRDEAVQFTT